jgi:hypothetical protein
MKKIALLFFCLVLGGELLAQAKKGVVRGRIVDAVDKVFAPGATISIQKLPDSTVVGFTMSDEKWCF